LGSSFLEEALIYQPPKNLNMASFADAPAGDIAVGEKIFRTKCSQVRNVGFDG
jgi:hypothetical protein